MASSDGPNVTDVGSAPFLVACKARALRGAARSDAPRISLDDVVTIIGDAVVLSHTSRWSDHESTLIPSDIPVGLVRVEAGGRRGSD